MRNSAAHVGKFKISSVSGPSVGVLTDSTAVVSIVVVFRLRTGRQFLFVFASARQF